MSTEVELLRGQVKTLQTEVDALRTAHDTSLEAALTTQERVESLEKRFAAMEMRMTHIDHLLGSMQLDIRRLQKSLAALQLEQTAKLNGLEGMLHKVLDLLQTK